MRRHLMAIHALAMVVVHAEDDPPLIELPVGDVGAPIAIPVLYVRASTLERDAKDGVEGMIMFDAVVGAQDLVSEALADYTPNLVMIDAEEVHTYIYIYVCMYV